MRLTNDIRDCVRNHATFDAFNKKEKSLELKGHKIAERIYNSAYTKKERDFMESAPTTEMFGTSKTFKIQFCGEVHNVSLGESKRFPFKKMDNYYTPIYTLEVDSATGRAFEKHAATILKLEEGKKSFMLKLRQLLYGFNTDKQLLEAWPEGKKYLSKHVHTGSRAVVPDSLINDINNTLKG
jgi:hypothetical protein